MTPAHFAAGSCFFRSTYMARRELFSRLRALSAYRLSASELCADCAERFEYALHSSVGLLVGESSLVGTH